MATMVCSISGLRLVRRVLDELPAPLAPGSGPTPMLTNLRLTAVDTLLTDLTVVRLTEGP